MHLGLWPVLRRAATDRAKTRHINFDTPSQISISYPSPSPIKPKHRAKSKMKISHGALIFLAFEAGKVSAGFSSYLSSISGTPSAQRPASYAPSGGAKPLATADAGLGNYLSNLDNGVLKTQPVLGDQQQPGITYAPSAPTMLEAESKTSASSADYM